MKCRAEAVRREEWESRLTREYGSRAIRAIQHEAARLLLGAFPWFAVDPERLTIFFREQTEICERELNGNMSGTIWVKDRRGRHRGDDFDVFDEAAEDTIFRLGRALGEHGIDADELFARVIPDEQRKVFLGDEIVYKEGREAWAKLLGRRAFCIWIASSGLALLVMRYPSEKRRFAASAVRERFMVPLADYCGRWLHGFIAGNDGRLGEETAETGRRLRERYGVELAAAGEAEKRTFEIPTVSGKGMPSLRASALLCAKPPEDERAKMDAALQQIIDKARELGLHEKKGRGRT